MRSLYFSLLLLAGCLVLVVIQSAPTPESEDFDDAYSKSLGYGTLYPRLEWDESLEEPIEDDDSTIAQVEEVNSRMPASARAKQNARNRSRKSNGKGCRKGLRKHPVLGVCRPHLGTDYQMKIGTPIKSKQGGRVVKADWGNGFGKVIGIRHGNCTAIYAHLSVISVKVGQQVRAGQLIGKSGNSGLSSGPHLHYEKCSQVYTETDLDLEDLGGGSGVFADNSEKGILL